MQLHLDEIGTKVAPGAHAFSFLTKPVRTAPRNSGYRQHLPLLPLPPRSPELNSQENIWQFMGQNWLSNRVFSSFDIKSFDDIVDHCCFAWNTLIGQPWKIMSIGRRDWATVGYSF